MLLSIPQILNLAANAGFTGSDLATAAAIALAETSPPGNSLGPYNPEQSAGAAPGQGSYGLWQIYLSKHQGFDPNQLTNDPAYNAAAAFSIYQAAGNSFIPWTTFKTGKYLSFLGQVNQVIASSAPAPADGSIPSGDGTGDGASIDQSTTNGTLTNYWPLLLAGGFALVLALRG